MKRKGQSFTEYIIILACISLLTTFAWYEFGQVTLNLFTNINNKLTLTTPLNNIKCGNNGINNDKGNCK